MEGRVRIVTSHGPPLDQHRLDAVLPQALKDPTNCLIVLDVLKRDQARSLVKFTDQGRARKRGSPSLPPEEIVHRPFVEQRTQLLEFFLGRGERRRVGAPRPSHNASDEPSSTQLAVATRDSLQA